MAGEWRVRGVRGDRAALGGEEKREREGACGAGQRLCRAGGGTAALWRACDWVALLFGAHHAVLSWLCLSVPTWLHCTRHQMLCIASRMPQRTSCASMAVPVSACICRYTHAQALCLASTVGATHWPATCTPWATT